MRQNATDGYNSLNVKIKKTFEEKMKTFFKLFLAENWQMFLTFCVILNFKIRLLFWKETTETVLFDSFLKEETTQLFVEYYFPVLYKQFVYLQDFSLTCKDNES